MKKYYYVLLVKTDKGWMNWCRSTNRDTIEGIQNKFTNYKTKIKRELTQ